MSQFMDLTDASRILKIVYGCIYPGMSPFFASHAEIVRFARKGRSECAAKLGAARKRRDAWEVEVHKGHLQGFDSQILAPPRRALWTMGAKWGAA